MTETPRPTIRVVDLETTGSTLPAHRVCEIGWQDVVLGDDGWTMGASGATLVDPERPMPAVTSAVHHLTDEDVAGAPRWFQVAPAVLGLGRERGIVAFAAHRADFEQRWCTPAFTGGLPWICTWKGALRVWPDAPSFSNQSLRYWRRPAGLDRARGLPAHRAGPDAYVTAHHLRDMLAVAPVDKLIGWNAEPGLLPRVPRGPDRGKRWSELDKDTLRRELRDRDEDIRFSAAAELARRAGAGPAPAPAQAALL
ncbi:MAG: putative exonuclease [uncultured Sphingomonadaceae bacterium]|uniref:Putative exonuclease n=1 Tax=uncultured Sphingomonadaceae bacterium TaxID=169976 RepID=A0A6J4S163_9SPHN|nr:MAG: putative exonuclease [uncultured Sphingomonadaceae bacterium]